MKLISFTVPCYNSQDYMAKCIDSLLVMGDEAEIIIINDGSKDNTGAIADEYAAKYPEIIKVVHQENGGHGEGINQGLKNATGKYFKVVDSDDWLDEEALKKVVDEIRTFEEGQEPELIVTNFIYDKISNNTRYLSHYRQFLKSGYNAWNDVKRFNLWHMMLMHALMYRTDVLRGSGIVLPKHTFYEDNVFAFVPLKYTSGLYYIDADLYHYLIGREDQSVTVKNIVKNYQHQLRDMDCIIHAHTMDEIEALPKGLKRYLKHFIRSVMANTLYFTCGDDSPERREGLKAMWDKIKESDKKMYKFLRYHTYAAILMPLPWKIRGWLAGVFYKILCSVVKLG